MLPHDFVREVDALIGERVAPLHHEFDAREAQLREDEARRGMSLASGHFLGGLHDICIETLRKRADAIVSAVATAFAQYDDELTPDMDGDVVVL
jgi:hypothetical protein